MSPENQMPLAKSSPANAAHVLAGFRFQFYQSLAAWIELGDSETLFLEASEDFSIAAGATRTDVQVKNSRAKRKATAHSLQSAVIVELLDRFWMRSIQTPTVDINLTFIATGGASTERQYRFPDNMPGLQYWQRAALDGDTAPIRIALGSIFEGRPIGLWLSTNPSDDELRTKLLRKVQWAIEAAPLGELEELVRDRIATIFLNRGLPISAANDAVRALLDRIFETASDQDLDNRKLTRLQLHRVIEEMCKTVALHQVMAGTNPHPQLDLIEHSLLVRPVEELPQGFARRSKTVHQLLTQAQGEPFIWIHGSHGVGKSTLAKLLAFATGGQWAVVDLRPVQDNAVASLAALRELSRNIGSGNHLDGIVIDDLSDPALNALLPRIRALGKLLSARGGRIIVTSNQEPLPAKILELGCNSKSVLHAPYLSLDDVEELVAGEPGPVGDMIKPWALFIRVSTSGGHPQLVLAKVASLRSRGWPDDALIEDLGPKGSVSLRATRDDAKRQLLSELATLGQARSEAATDLIKRMACVFDRLDDGLVRLLASHSPKIDHLSDILPILRGPWLELLPQGDYRVSPLFADVSADVSAKDAMGWRQSAAEYWLASGTLNERTLPLCFWNALLGKHVWVLLKLCQVLQSLSREKFASVATLLSPITAFAMDRPIFPEAPPLSAQMRLLQFDVADAIAEGKIARRAAVRLLDELDQIEIEPLKDIITTVSAQRVLAAPFAETPRSTQLDFALRLRQALPRTLSLANGELVDPQEILQNPQIDMAGFLFSALVVKIKGSEDFLELIQALDRLQSGDRDSFIDATKVLLEGLNIFAHGGWSRDQLEGRDMSFAKSRYDAVTKITDGWKRNDLTVELICAQSVILDEGLGDSTAALKIVEESILVFGPESPLIRQKAKVLGRLGRDQEAANILIEIEDKLAISSSLERAIALRDGGVSAARATFYSDAIRLLTKAIDCLSESADRDALKAGFQIELALALWKGGSRPEALIKVGEVFDTLERINSTSSRQNEWAHMVARAAPAVFLRDLGNYFGGGDTPLQEGKSSLIFSEDDSILGASLKPLADNWRILALVEAEAGLDVGIDARSVSKQTGNRVISIETLLARIRYSKSLTGGDTAVALQNGLLATQLMILGLEQGDSGGDIARVDIPALEQVRVRELCGIEKYKTPLTKLLLDLLVFMRLRGDFHPAAIANVQRVWEVNFDGRIFDRIIQLAAGRDMLGASVDEQEHLAAALSRSDDEIARDPHGRFARDLLLVSHAATSLATGAIAPLVVKCLADGWAWVLEHQRFRLKSPHLYCTEIEALVERLDIGALRTASELLAQVAPAVSYELTDNWKAFLEAVR